jgi:hypothetical protein
MPVNGHHAEAKPSHATSSTATLSHSLNHDKSILALVVSSTNIIAGTEGGEMLVRLSPSACRVPWPNLIVAELPSRILPKSLLSSCPQR